MEKKVPWTPGKWNVREGLNAILPESGGSIPVPAYWIEQDGRTPDQNCVACVVPRKADAVVMAEAPAMAEELAKSRLIIENLIGILAQKYAHFFPIEGESWMAVRGCTDILRRIGYPGFEPVVGTDIRD